jgi:hypothetical protein
MKSTTNKIYLGLLIIQFAHLLISCKPSHVKVGDHLYDGIVFYVDSSEQNGLIADTIDLRDAQWSEALKECVFKGKGWHLPNNDEIGKLYRNKNIIGGFDKTASPDYWSSDEFSYTQAWYIDFKTGEKNFMFNKNNADVRAIRAFRNGKLIIPNDTLLNSAAQPTTITNNETTETPMWRNQKLKAGERIVTIKWGMNKTIGLSKDMPYDGGHYCSDVFVVPTGKKWILLYNKETRKSGSMTVEWYPIICVNGEVNSDITYDDATINLERYRDKAIRYYEGDKIMGIDLQIVKLGGSKPDYFSGELCFLEINS